jgi:hypothetical protein
MRDVIIHRCPVCDNIRTHTEQLVAELRNVRGVGIDVMDGNKGEFTIEADGRRINGKKGDLLRDPTELAAEIRGIKTASA